MTSVCAATEYRLRIELGDAKSVEYSYGMNGGEKVFFFFMSKQEYLINNIKLIMKSASRSCFNLCSTSDVLCYFGRADWEFGWNPKANLIKFKIGVAISNMQFSRYKIKQNEAFPAT